MSEALALALPEVPDLAMVPKFFIKSSFVIPIPLSRIESTFRSVSNLIYKNNIIQIISSTSIQLIKTTHTKATIKTYLDVKLGSFAFAQYFLISE